MEAKKSADADKRFTVVLRGPGAIVFKQAERLRMEGIRTEFGPLTITYATRWVKFGDETTVPGQVWIEVIGSGPNLDAVMVLFANASMIALPILALAANCAIG